MDYVKQTVKDYAREIGFDLVGIASAETFRDHGSVTLKRIEQGFMDGLPWFTPSRVKRGMDPNKLLPGAKSIISVGLSYFVPSEDEKNSLNGKVARYAWGDDYHKVMKKRLKLFVEGISERLNRNISARWYVDDGPMVERAVAQRSGVGWFGKNTNIINPEYGSWIFLGQVITDLELVPDVPLKKTCGNCTRCIADCPTSAIVAPFVIDNKKCISFLTIENRGEIPRWLRPLMSDWVFGCDICQDVCPVNRKAKPTREPAFQVGEHGFTSLELIPLLSITDLEFKQRFANSPIRRAKRSGLVRNVCVALGNIGDISAIPALIHTLKDKDPMVRSHCAWAIGQIGGSLSYKALEVALQEESDDDVVAEITLALDQTNQIIKTTI